MTVTSELSPDRRQLTLYIAGRFDFATHQAFRGAYEGQPGDLSYVVDLRDTHYLTAPRWACCCCCATTPVVTGHRCD